MLHLYWGDGKGKTTAAMGLALRALGHGRRVVILRNQREAAETQVALRLKIMQVLFAKLVQSGPLHRLCSPIHKIAIELPQKDTALAPIQGRRLLCFRGTTRFAVHTVHHRFVSALTPQVRSAHR